MENGTSEPNTAKDKRQFLHYYSPSKDGIAESFRSLSLGGAIFFVVLLLSSPGLPGTDFADICIESLLVTLSLIFFAFVILLILYMRVSSRIRKIEKSGELDHVLNDFRSARGAMEDRFRIGKDFLYVKLSKTAILNYNDIDRLEVSLEGGDRVLNAYLKSRKKRCLCSLKRVDEADVQQFIRALRDKNPTIQIG